MEKITINLTPVDLGRIDMLVEEGFYQNRSDFIRAAIRRELESHDAVLAAKAKRHDPWHSGVLRLSRADLEQMARDASKRDLFGVGSLIVEADVPVSLVDWVFRRIRWYGAIESSAAVRAAIERKGS
jgi:Arc/MetJ-type ribon-helix-helix transcriptional regulator